MVMNARPGAANAVFDAVVKSLSRDPTTRTTSASRARRFAAGRAGHADRAERLRMIERQRALARLRLADRRCRSPRRSAERVRSLRCRCTPPPATIERARRARISARRVLRAASRSADARGDRPDARLEQRRRDSRTPRPARPAASASVTAPVSAGEVSTRIASGSADDELLGPVDAIPVARHRLEAVVDGHVLRLRRLELLQHRMPAGGAAKMSPGSSSTGSAVDGGAAAAPVTMFVAPGPIERGARERAAAGCVILANAAAVCTIACSLRAQVVTAVDAGRLQQRLADAGHVAVTEDAEDAGKERLLAAVA